MLINETGAQVLREEKVWRGERRRRRLILHRRVGRFIIVYGLGADGVPLRGSFCVVLSRWKEGDDSQLAGVMSGGESFLLRSLEDTVQYSTVQYSTVHTVCFVNVQPKPQQAQHQGTEIIGTVEVGLQYIL
jgi:hypothetical protein